MQPFTNYLITMTLTGAQIDELLEQQFVVDRTLQISEAQLLVVHWRCDRIQGRPSVDHVRRDTHRSWS